MMRHTQTSPTKAERAGLTAIRYANKAIRIFEDIVFIVILLIGLWYMADTIYVFYHSRTEATMPFKPTDGDIVALQKELSEDCVGWITLDDTSIDYPVMQGVDNYVYLNKDPYGDYSLAGSIFLDARNASDLSNDYSVVYGHHMSGGFMFGSLDEFEDSAYFAEHTTGTLTTERGEFPVETIAFLYTDVKDDLVFNFAGDAEQVEAHIEEKAINYRAVTGERILALTTCKSPTSTRRACLFVRVIE